MMDNLINEIEITTFRNCMKLKILNLENRAKIGRINSLKSGTFSSLINLEVLQLGGHQISSISSRIFENLLNLKLLSLKKNKITQIDGQAFTALIKLENLDLSENNFNYLPSNVFINLHNIENLNLKSCQLKDIPSSIINLKTLKFFDISQNQLPWLLLYPSFKNMESFDFYSNKITAINPKFFNEIFLNESIPSSSFNLNQCENRNDCSYQFNNLHFCNIEKDKKFEYSCKVDKFEIKKSTYTRDVVKYLETKNKPLDIQVFELFELYENVSTVQLWNSDITDIYGIKSCSNLKFFDLRMNKIEILYESH
ncbi:hypothetical protein PVAND_003467 [Polypedilum vanderplanki]|uniref:Uncharacterized protein n=1 Tax=Polypedilum vanderplanki TaxID=319348 RepID=A0A9J6BU50_POLVA|nr:hypothetical protein PVAND_003467 [Polypedilum vanderplanki]